MMMAGALTITGTPIPVRAVAGAAVIVVVPAILEVIIICF